MIDKRYERPKLRRVLIPGKYLPGEFYITMSPGQWDPTLKAFYDEGATLLEVKVKKNGSEKIVRAYRKEETE